MVLLVPCFFCISCKITIFPTENVRVSTGKMTVCLKIPPKTCVDQSEDRILELALVFTPVLTLTQKLPEGMFNALNIP